MLKLSDVKTDCRHFRGHIPCRPNKDYGVMCNDCSYYDKTKQKILIIKLGAAGDVIRTTPLLHPLKKEFPESKIYWLTNSPELVPSQTNPKADEILTYSLPSVSFLESVKFDLVINLDKDYEAISLTDRISAGKKLGYTLKDGVCYPCGKSAEKKYLTGIFDQVSKANKLNYMQEIFEICGYEFRNEKYLLDTDKSFDRNWEIDFNKKVIGLNTGCGERWTSRLWRDEYWIELIKKLKSENYEVLLLGGPGEDNKNIFLKESTGAEYFGVFDLKTFINLVSRCDVIVSQVTMSMHIAIAMQRKLVLMNNIFNPDEFDLYGNGEIVQPQKECKCYFRPKCINPDYKCMDFLTPEDVYKACIRQLS
ncbi:MAG: glycosyltransferase family 9 protein [Ignavibacteria bacterium]|nr:glycosyltransferase family 9 protein [Ignavibacteria bacterium]